MAGRPDGGRRVRDVRARGTSNRMTAPFSDGAMWKAEDVATFLRASKSWVYERAAEGTIPCIRISGMLRFSPEKIRAFANGELEGTRTVVVTKTTKGE